MYLPAPRPYLLDWTPFCLADRFAEHKYAPMTGMIPSLPAIIVGVDAVPKELLEWLQNSFREASEIRTLVPASAVGMTSSDTDVHIKGADALLRSASEKRADQEAMHAFARRIYDTLQNNPDATAGWLGAKPDTSFQACMLTALVCGAPPEAQMTPGRVIAPDGLPGPIRCVGLRIHMDANI